MTSNLQQSFTPIKAILGAIALTVCGASQAAQDGFYLGANANVSIGPSVVTVSNAAFPSGTTYTSGGNTNAFGLSNDGRFQYDAALGYIKNNFGLELRYIYRWDHKNKLPKMASPWELTSQAATAVNITVSMANTSYP